MRTKVLFNDNWTFTGQSGIAEAVTLPHTWNAKDGQDGGNDYYRGTCLYEKKFTRPDIKPNEQVWVEFAGAAMSAHVELNGTELACHKGGYSTFRVNLTDALYDDPAVENILRVTVDNGKNTEVYPQKADFTFYGGIYRNVYLITACEHHFALDNFGAPGIRVTAEVTGIGTENVHAAVTAEAEVESACDRDYYVEFSVDGLEETKKANIADQKAAAVFELDAPHLWNGIKDPYLYHIRAKLIQKEQNKDIDEIETDFGIRTFEVDSERGFILNGKEYRLCGAARHQDREGAGNVLTEADMEEDMAIMRDMGANTIRLAHYQHDRYFYDLCDRTGMIVWAEIPYITEHLSTARENAISQMKELVLQNYNHPSIVCWGLSNEITATGGVNEDMVNVHKELNDLCHSLDATRPTTMAHVFMLDSDDDFVTLPDIRSYNLYYGWYLGELEQNDEFFDNYHRKHPNEVIGLSEFGADANPAYHSANPVKGDWTEDYQAIYHEHMLAMWEKRPFIWAMHCWNMFDFGADGRDEGGKPGQNQKGLVTFDRKIKKDAFYIYKAYLSDDPFVHLCGSRYVNRAEDETEIKVYSNLKKIALYVDGKLFEEKEGDKVFTFRVPISGEHKIRAVAEYKIKSTAAEQKNKSAAAEQKNKTEAAEQKSKTAAASEEYSFADEMIIRHVSEPDPSYVKEGSGGVVNWFDREDEIVKEGFFSVKNSIAEIKANPAAKEVYDRLTGPLAAAAAARYGDVAKNIEMPPEIQRQMDAMSVEATLMQMGDLVKPELVHRLNAELNRIVY